MIDAIEKNITVFTENFAFEKILVLPELTMRYIISPFVLSQCQTEWADQVPKWEICGGNKTACPDMYV